MATAPPNYEVLYKYQLKCCVPVVTKPMALWHWSRGNDANEKKGERSKRNPDAVEEVSTSLKRRLEKTSKVDKAAFKAEQ